MLGGGFKKKHLEFSFSSHIIHKLEGLSYCALCLCPPCSIYQLYCKIIFEILNIWVNIYIVIYQYMCKYRVYRKRRRVGIFKIVLCRFCQYSSSLRTPCGPGSSSTFSFWIFTTKKHILESYWIKLI